MKAARLVRRWALSALLVAALGSACGPDTRRPRVADGLFATFADGIVSVELSFRPEDSVVVNVSPLESVVSDTALDEAFFRFPGALFVGRRGTCVITVDLLVAKNERSSCDFEVLQLGSQAVIDVKRARLSYAGLIGDFSGALAYGATVSGAKP